MIEKSYVLALGNRIEAFRRAGKKSQSIFSPPITPSGLWKNMYYGIVENLVVPDDLFAPLI